MPSRLYRGGPSLGWDVLRWMRAKLDFAPTDEQADFILAWYELDPDGDFLYRRALLELAKGWGKSPLAAALALAEFCGPVRFSGRYRANGDPIGMSVEKPWVVIAAVSEDQTDNTYGALYELLAENEHKAAKALEIDDGRTRLYLKGNPAAKLEPVTSSAGAREGQRTTFTILDETHLWHKTNGGQKLARTIRRNAAKMGGRTLETTNAPVLGGGSVAEGSNPEAPDPGVLHYARRPVDEPDPEWPDERLIAALDEAYGEASWIDRRRLVAEIRDPETPWEDALRFFFNVRSAGQSKAIDPRLWDSRADPREVPAGTYIGIGFDGSISEDATILRGCCPDGYSFLIDAWVRPANAPDDWKVPRLEVHEKVAWAFSYYKVGRMLCDPPKWWTEIEQWEKKYGMARDGKPRVMGLYTDSQARMAPAVDRWMVSLREGSHTHDDDPITNAHVKATHKEPVRVNAPESDGRTMYKLKKGEGPDRKLIDACIADVLALEAAMTMPPQRVRSELFVSVG